MSTLRGAFLISPQTGGPLQTATTAHWGFRLAGLVQSTFLYINYPSLSSQQSHVKSPIVFPRLQMSQLPQDHTASEW